jgi:hypothetical protein
MHTAATAALLLLALLLPVYMQVVGKVLYAKKAGRRLMGKPVNQAVQKAANNLDKVRSSRLWCTAA